MKTFPPDQEYHDIGTLKDTIAEEKTSDKLQEAQENFQYCKRNNISKDSNSSESDNLIICNPGLASSFQTLKSQKHKLSPGHYLQRVFLTSLAQKFRSQSLPNCCEKRQQSKDKIEDIHTDFNETSVPLVQPYDVDARNLGVSDSRDFNTEGWFKTWPERSVDKISNRGETSQAEDGNSSVFESVNIDKQVHLDLYSDEVDFTCNRVDKQNNDTTAPHTSNYLNIHNSDQYLNSKKVNDNLFRNTERINKSNLTGAISTHNGNQIKNSVRLDDILDSFPFAYSPVTKQLLLIKSDKNSSVERPSSGFSEIGLCCNEFSERKKFDEELNLEGIESDFEAPGGTKECADSSKGRDCDLPLRSLHRVNTEVSSFSSTVSSLSDISPSLNEDSALGSLLDHGDTCSLVSVGGCSAFSEDSVGAESKKKSLTGFISRNVFNWKSGSGSEDNFGRWKLFGKNSSPLSSHSSLTTESEGGSLAPDSPCGVWSSSSRVASSSALIQLDRPANLPAKSEEEQARHRAQYQQILDAAKKKELKEAKLRKKQLQMQLKAEEQLARDIRIWTQEILPRWEQMHISKKARELWWQGVPPCVRGKVWKLAIGNPLQLTHSLYNIYVQRAQDRLRSGGPSSEDDKEASMELIQLDISRTFPHLCIFQRGGPYYDMLHCLLAAYVCYRPDVGYVQGMSFIAAVLILNMEAADAFVCFANLLDKPCHQAFFHLSQSHMQAYYSTYDQLFRENLPELHAHFTSTTLTPDLYLLDWIYTVFTKTMNLDLACRVWDVFLRDGEQFLFRTALGVLHLCQDVLLQMDFVRGSQFLTRLPDDLQGEQLFKSISCIRMTVGKQTFQDILALHYSDLDTQ